MSFSIIGLWIAQTRINTGYWRHLKYKVRFSRVSICDDRAEFSRCGVIERLSSNFCCTLTHIQASNAMTSNGFRVFLPPNGETQVIETAANLGNPLRGIDYRMTSPANPRHDDVSVNSVRGSFGRRRHPSSFIRGFEEDLGVLLQISSKGGMRSDVGTHPDTVRPVDFAVGPLSLLLGLLFVSGKTLLGFKAILSYYCSALCPSRRATPLDMNRPKSERNL